MWAKNSKPPGEGKERRDQAMTSQAEMILKKKREIEAKMAADEKKEKMAGQPRKPISMSISKRWGLKGKKEAEGGNSETRNKPSSSSSGSLWKKYSGESSSKTTSSYDGKGLPAPPSRQSAAHSATSTASRHYQDQTSGGGSSSKFSCGGYPPKTSSPANFDPGRSRDSPGPSYEAQRQHQQLYDQAQQHLQQQAPPPQQLHLQPPPAQLPPQLPPLSQPGGVPRFQGVPAGLAQQQLPPPGFQQLQSLQQHPLPQPLQPPPPGLPLAVAQHGPPPPPGLQPGPGGLPLGVNLPGGQQGVPQPTGVPHPAPINLNFQGQPQNIHNMPPPPGAQPGLPPGAQPGLPPGAHPGLPPPPGIQPGLPLPPGAQPGLPPPPVSQQGLPPPPGSQGPLPSVPQPNLQGPPPLGMAQSHQPPPGSLCPPQAFEGMQVGFNPAPPTTSGSHPTSLGLPASSAPCPGISQPPPFQAQSQPQYDMTQPPPAIQTAPVPPPPQVLPSGAVPVPQPQVSGAQQQFNSPPPQLFPPASFNPTSCVGSLPINSAPPVSSHPTLIGSQPFPAPHGLQSQPQSAPMQPPPTLAAALPSVQYPPLVPPHNYPPPSGPETIMSQPPPSVSQPQPILSLSTPAFQPPPPVMNQPPPVMSIGPPPPAQVTQVPPVPAPLLLSQPPPIPSTSLPLNVSFPPPITVPLFGLPDSSQPPPPVPAPNTAVPPPAMAGQRDPGAPNWWGDALAKAKTIATTLSKEGEPVPDQSEEEGHCSSGGHQSRNSQHSSSHRSSSHNQRHRSGSRERRYDRERGRDRGRDRSPRDRRRSRSRNARDSGGSDRSGSRHHRERERHGSGSENSSSRRRAREDEQHQQRDKRDQQPENYGYKSDNYGKATKSSEVAAEPRDIDMRKSRRESTESYSPTRPDYKPSPKSEDYSSDNTPLPSVVEELASMVAVSGEDLEDIARDRNKLTPELKFLYERTGHLYKKYRARVAELKRSFEETKQEPSRPGPSTSAQSQPEPTRKRKSRWGDSAQRDPPASIPPPGLVSLAPTPPAGPAGIGAPGVAIPMSLGGTVQAIAPTPPPAKPASALAAYAVKVFGTTNLSEQQWKQCEDQMKMSVVYGQLAAKQAAAKIMAAAGKKQMEYDSDEDTEGGTWEHKARTAEMAKTQAEASKLTKDAEDGGKHHIGDFLPPEELAKFMNKYKAMRSGTPWDNSDYQDNKLGQSNLGFQMLQKMGWNEGAGLGAGGTGITAPIGKSGNVAERAGLGSDRPGEINEDDDEFDQYRKRMMMAYRFRPNPLNNPRRSYY